MKSEVWGILIANAVACLVLYIVQRWRKDIFFALVGIWFIVLPSVFARFDGRMPLVEAILAPAGILLIAADMRERLPGRAAVRKKIGFRDPD